MAERLGGEPCRSAGPDVLGKRITGTGVHRYVAELDQTFSCRTIYAMARDLATCRPASSHLEPCAPHYYSVTASKRHAGLDSVLRWTQRKDPANTPQRRQLLPLRRR